MVSFQLVAVGATAAHTFSISHLPTVFREWYIYVCAFWLWNLPGATAVWAYHRKVHRNTPELKCFWFQHMLTAEVLWAFCTSHLPRVGRRCSLLVRSLPYMFSAATACNFWILKPQDVSACRRYFSFFAYLHFFLLTPLPSSNYFSSLIFFLPALLWLYPQICFSVCPYCWKFDF